MTTTATEFQALSINDAAKRVGVSRETLRQAVIAGTLPAKRIREGGRILISLSDLEGWFNALDAAYPRTEP